MRCPLVVMKVFALVFLALMIQTPNSLAAAPTLNDRLEDCRTISEALERLGCYDQIGLEPPTTAALPDQAPSTTTVASSTPETGETSASREAAEARFGYELSVKDAPDKLTSTVESVRKNAKGGLVVTLANGQIWQQSGTERLFLDEGESVTILRGAFSAFHLVVNGKGRRYRFARVD